MRTILYDKFGDVIRVAPVGMLTLKPHKSGSENMIDDPKVSNVTRTDFNETAIISSGAPLLESNSQSNTSVSMLANEPMSHSSKTIEFRFGKCRLC